MLQGLNLALVEPLEADKVIRLGFMALASLLLSTLPAWAQSPGGRIDVWDMPLGGHYSTFPMKFIGHACGSNGGPPGVPLAGLSEANKCPADRDGLREIYLRHDDEPEYWAKAHDYQSWIKRFQGTQVIDREVILSLLLNGDGLVYGVRVVTDPDIDEAARYDANSLGMILAARFAMEAGNCVDLPQNEREIAIGEKFIKQRCEKIYEQTRRVILETRFYRKAGQTAIDPHTRLPTEGQFESSTRLEIRLAPGVTHAPQPPATSAVVAEQPTYVPGTPEAAFMAGRSRTCRGCNLAGANLKRFELDGVDLSGAMLAGANLHDASLERAILTDANLSDANLNKARLRNADLSRTNMTNVMLYEARADNANFTAADLTGAKMARIRLTRARLPGAVLNNVDLREARLSQVDLSNAQLSQSWLDNAQFSGAVLRGATIIQSSLLSTQMRGADLAGARINGSDLYDADLNGANLAGADLSASRLQSAILTDADLTGTVLAGTIMPDGTVHE